MAAFSALLAILIAALVLGSIMARRQGNVPILAILVAAAIPALLIAASVNSADHGTAAAGMRGGFGDLRIALSSVDIKAEALRDGITLGGDAKEDALYVSLLPKSLLAVRANPQLGVDIFLGQPARTEDAAGLVSVEDASPGIFSKLFRGEPELIGTRVLQPGERLCPGCPTPSVCGLSLAASHDHFDGPGAAEYPLFQPVTGARKHIYPLRNFGIPSKGVAPTLCIRNLMGTMGRNAVPAFLYRSGIVVNWRGISYEWRVAPLDAPPQDAVASLLPGGPAKRVHLFRVLYAQNADDEIDHPSHIAERRSLVLKVDGDGNLHVAFDTPEYLQLDAQAIATIVGEKKGQDIVLPIDNQQAASRPFAGDTTLQFNSLGGPLAETALGRIVLHTDPRTFALRPYFTVPGQGSMAFGSSFTLGGTYAANFTLSRLDRETGVVRFLDLPFLLVAAAVFLLAAWPARALPYPAWCVIVLTQTLLAMRVLVAVSGTYIDPIAEPSLVTAALIAYLAVPFIAVRLVAPSWQWWRTVIYAGFIALAAWRFGIALTGDKTSLIVVTAVGAILAADLLAVFRPANDYVRSKAANVAAFSARWGGRIGTKAREWLWEPPIRRLAASPGAGIVRTAHWSWEQLDSVPMLRAILCWLTLILLLRIGLALIGVREGIPLGSYRLALSTFYLPLVLLALGHLTSVLAQNWIVGAPSRLWQPLCWALAVAAAFMVPVVANDNGFVIFAFGMGVCGLLVLAARPQLTQSIWTTIAATALLVAIALILSVLVHTVVDLGGGARKAILAFTGMAITSAWLIHAVSKARRSWAILLFVVLVVSAGSLLLLLPTVQALILLIGIGIGAAAIIRVPAVTWALPAIFALGLGLSLQMPEPSATIALTVASSHDEQDALRQLDLEMGKTQNILRLWYNIRPKDIGAFGTDEGQNLGAAMSHLHDYTSCPDTEWPACLLGHGYLSVPQPTILRAYHMSDNVTAIHLIAPFGRLGAALLLGVIAVTAGIASWAAIGRKGEPISLPGGGSFVALAALWTIFGAALYMVLANMQVLPFTGKNVYFLAAASGSDLIEGTILILIAVMSFKAART